MKPRIIIGYVDSWQIRDKKDVHPSHRTAVVELEDIRQMIEEKLELDKHSKKFQEITNSRNDYNNGYFQSLRDLLKELEGK